MKKYRIFHPLAYAFFSPSLYRDVAQRWTGIAAGYLLMLLAICWIPVFITWTIALNQFSAMHSPEFLKTIPSVSIVNGVVNVDKPQPYIVSNPKTGERLAVTDTTGTITTLEQAQAPILLTQDKLIVRKSDNQSSVYNLSNVENMGFTALQVKQLIDKSMLWLVFIVIPFALVFSFIYRILQALVYAACGMLFSILFKVELTYQQCMRLAIIAVTPAVVVGTICDVLHLSFANQYLTYFLITMAYLMFAVISNQGIKPVMPAAREEQGE